MRAPLILLPPSEGKAAGGRGKPFSDGSLSLPPLDAARREVARALEAAMDDDALSAKLLGVKGDTLIAARQANRDVFSAGTLSAIDRYTGVLYDALDYSSLDATAKRRAGSQVLIFSGLWGAVGPKDRIPDYKLKMGATLPGIGKLNTWWRQQLSAALHDVVANRTVWDLLPNEHVAAWAPEPTAVRRRISVSFVDESTDAATGEPVHTVVNHWNKLLKGALVRHVLSTQLDNAQGLAEFDHPLGYRYRPELTTTHKGITKVTMIRTVQP